MYQKESKIHYFEQFGEALTRLFDFKHKGIIDQAESLLNRSFERFLSVSPDIFDNVSPQKVIDFLLSNFIYNTTQLAVLAELLKERGEIFCIKGEKECALFNYQLSLNIFEFVEHEERIYSLERMEKIICLQAEIAQILASVS